MLEQSHRLSLDKLVDHVTQDGSNGVEAFVGVADVREASLVEKDLLNDEDRNCLGEFRAGLHNAQAQRDDFGRKQEVDDSVVVILLHDL